MDLAPIYQARPGDYGEFIDPNQYDIVKVNWEVPRLKYCQKVQVDIPVHLGDDIEIGLHAYWQSRASSSDGTGPVYARDNVVEMSSITFGELVGQPVMITWEKTYGGSEEDMAHSLIQTNDGGYAVAGKTYSKGAGECDFWVVKLDSRGNKLWDKTYGGSSWDIAISLIQTTDGGYVVAGKTSSKGAGKSDVWIIKLDNQGNILWDKTFGGSYIDYAESLIQTNDGGYAVAVTTCSYGTGGFDLWVIKLDSRGNKLWDKTYGGNFWDWATSLIQTNDGGYAVAGHTLGEGEEDFWIQGEREEDFWILKLDEQGNLK